MGEGPESKPGDVHASRLKSLGTLVAAMAALVAAIGSWFKPQDQSVNKASYEALSASMKDLSDQVDKDHDEIVALRGYTEGALRMVSAPASSVSAAGTKDAGQSTVTLHAVGVIEPASSSRRALDVRPPRSAPPSFQDVMQKAKN